MKRSAETPAAWGGANRGYQVDRPAVAVSKPGTANRRFHWFLSYALVAAGAVLVFQGSRLVVESRLGQSQAAREFEARHTTGEAQAQPPRLGQTIARMSIPRLHTDLYVVEGSDEEELRRGPGHMSGTAMPGNAGNCVIAGHRDTHFRALKDIRRGDDIILQTAAGQFLYRVEKLSIVSPRNTEALQPTSGPKLNLITCYPFYYVGAAPRRFIVEAQLAGSVAAAADRSERPEKAGNSPILDRPRS